MHSSHLATAVKTHHAGVMPHELVAQCLEKYLVHAHPLHHLANLNLADHLQHHELHEQNPAQPELHSKNPPTNCACLK